ncbi:MAG: hypothetical protein AAF557_03740 [Pseudomonadota bacterium]
MALQYPSWLTHLALADCLRTGGVFIGRDILALPLATAKSGGAFRATTRFRHLVLTGGGGRQLQDARPFDEDAIADGPIVLLTDGLTPDLIAGTVDRLPHPPDAVLHYGGQAPFAGYLPAGPALPGLFAPQTDRRFIHAVSEAAAKYKGAKNDGFDAIDRFCETTPFLQRLQFHVDGAVMVDLEPLPLLRRLDDGLGKELMLSGTVNLLRWRPATIRVPTFGLPDPEIRIRLSGKIAPDTVTCTCADRVGFAIQDHGDRAPDNALDIRLSCDARMLVDLTLAGHGVQLEAVSIRLPQLHPPDEDPKADPLEQFADPLGNYG